MAVIKVPKTPKRAFDTSRPPSGLIQAQIEHLEAALAATLPTRARARRTKPKTEGQAASHIEALTDQLYPQGRRARADAPAEKKKKKKARKKKRSVRRAR